jgi:hypothetical protein
MHFILHIRYHGKGDGSYFKEENSVLPVKQPSISFAWRWLNYQEVGKNQNRRCDGTLSKLLSVKI